MKWRRTEDEEHPEDGQVCLIFFAYTGYSISKFGWNKDEELAEALGLSEPDKFRMAVFYDDGGFLGDEDILWMPIEEYAGGLNSNPYPYPTGAYIADYPECQKYLKEKIIDDNGNIIYH